MKTATKTIDGHEVMFERRRYGSMTYTWASLRQGPPPAAGQDYRPDEWLSLGDPWPKVNPSRTEILAAIAQVTTPAPQPAPEPAPVDPSPERFTLNSSPKPVYWKAPKQPKAKQAVLFAGLNCCEGQNDLFQTDGQPQ